jgi:hypothetical protein
MSGEVGRANMNLADLIRQLRAQEDWLSGYERQLAGNTRVEVFVPGKGFLPVSKVWAFNKNSEQGADISLVLELGERMDPNETGVVG